MIIGTIMAMFMLVVARHYNELIMANEKYKILLAS